MKAEHLFGDWRLSGDADADAGVFLANETRSWVFLKDPPGSRYHGWFVRLAHSGSSKSTIFKILDHIEIHKRPTLLRNGFTWIARSRPNLEEKITLGTQSLHIVFSAPAEAELIFDVKELFSNEEGWHYTFESFQEHTVRIRAVQENAGTHLIIVLASDGVITPVNQWMTRLFPEDKKRGSPPWERHVWRAARAKGTTITLAAATTLEEAEQCIQSAAMSSPRSSNATEAMLRQGLHALFETTDPSVIFALLGCLATFASLQEGAHFWAGLPWFPQPWIRDELIALRALYRFNPLLSKKLVQDYLINLANLTDRNLFDTNGTPTFHAASDTIPLFMNTLADAVKNAIVAESDLANLRSTIKHVVVEYLWRRTNNGLIQTQPQETWMDSISREGFPIEIQCMTLKTLQFMKRIELDSHWTDLCLTMQKKVREQFYSHQGLLLDRIGDTTQRPNIFFAFLLDPELLSPSQWRHAFEQNLGKTWLPWGGLGTIAKDAAEFQPVHTGENSKSYHQGDSWFWLNNLAAVAMHQLAPTDFSPYISKIVQASIHNLLWQGALGYPSELSSASELKAEGASVQLWSAGTLIELLMEKNRKPRGSEAS